MRRGKWKTDKHDHDVHLHVSADDAMVEEGNHRVLAADDAGLPTFPAHVTFTPDALHRLPEVSGTHRTAALDDSSVTWHPKAAKDLKSLDKPTQRAVLDGLDGIVNQSPTTLAQTHPLAGVMKGWYATKVSRGHRIIHRPNDDGGVHVGYVGLHEYEKAIQRLTSLTAGKNGPDYDNLSFHLHDSDDEEHTLIAVHPQHGPVGALSYGAPGNFMADEITGIEVDPAHQRRGVARQMLHHVKTHINDQLVHSESRSDAGEAWAKAVDSEAPEVAAGRIGSPESVGTFDKASYERMLSHTRKTGAAEPDHESSYWHITDDPHFAPRADHVPEDNSISIRPRTSPGLYLTKHPESWVNGHGYVRPYIAEVHVPKGVGRPERYGGEHFVEGKDLDQVKVHRVIPLDEHVRETFHSPGWIEDHHGSAHDGRPMTPRVWGYHGFEQPLTEGYRYSGPDVRDMTPEQHAEHHRRYVDYMVENRGHDRADFED